VKLVHVEVETAALQAFLDGQDEELVTSELALTEVPRAIRRINHNSQRRPRVSRGTLAQGLATAADLLDRLGKIVIDAELFAAAGGYDADRTSVRSTPCTSSPRWTLGQRWPRSSPTTGRSPGR
jgi:hypothetical protein